VSLKAGYNPTCGKDFSRTLVTNHALLRKRNRSQPRGSQGGVILTETERCRALCGRY